MAERRIVRQESIASGLVAVFIRIPEHNIAFIIANLGEFSSPRLHAVYRDPPRGGQARSEVIAVHQAADAMEND